MLNLWVAFALFWKERKKKKKERKKERKTTLKKKIKRKKTSIMKKWTKKESDKERNIQLKVEGIDIVDNYVTFCKIFTNVKMKIHNR